MKPCINTFTMKLLLYTKSTYYIKKAFLINTGESILCWTISY